MFWFLIQSPKIDNKSKNYQVHLYSSKGQMLQWKKFWNKHNQTFEVCALS
jgi:hypothetical protein